MPYKDGVIFEPEWEFEVARWVDLSLVEHFPP